jgi:5'-nucleotidase
VTFLVSNDDGVDAPGLAALVAACQGLGKPVVVAPAGAQSGVSHAVTSDRAVRIEERGADRFALHGTPADCTRIGLLKLVPKADWVLSGINHGGNLGADVHYSGTVAAVREAVLHGWPGIAVSQYRRKGVEVDWNLATRWTARVLKHLLTLPVEPGLFYNVNLPHLSQASSEPEITMCPLDPNPLPLSYRHGENGHLFYDGNYHTRKRKPGADVDVCFSGAIAVTAVRLF